MKKTMLALALLSMSALGAQTEQKATDEKLVRRDQQTTVEIKATASRSDEDKPAKEPVHRQVSRGLKRAGNVVVNAVTGAVGYVFDAEKP